MSIGSSTDEGFFLPLGVSMEEVQKAYTLNTLEFCMYNKSRAAEMLNISRKTLYSKLRRWGHD